MTTIPPDAAPPRAHTGRRTFVVWAIAVGAIIALTQVIPLLRRAHFSTGPFSILLFLTWCVAIAITLYWMAVAVRWTMRKLFWRVGRRLFLSYVFVGVLPFFLMAILILVIAYMIAGVMSHAALRGERQATLGQMESWALEYGLTGKRPNDALPSLEIYDTDRPSGAALPEWLKQSSFSGMVTREKEPLLVTTRQFPGSPRRTAVFVQPIDDHWIRQLEEKGGMIIRLGQEKDKRNKNFRPAREGTRVNVDFDEERDMEALVWRSIGRKIIWADATALTEWKDGKTRDDHQLFTLIVNPVSNIFQYYFGRSERYVSILANVILGITVALLVIYMVAALFAAVLIFSISRAVNRIEKGTKAVERGDFTYRINMKPHNQLGEMAQSFDRMTASIASLLTTVAEKERLQSEIAIAATIQRNLLPKEGPHFRGVSFSAHFEPTASIGGDYYDVFNLDKSRLAVAIGDVSGHGLSTGLVMAMVKAAMTTLVEEGADEVSLFHRLNELVFRSTERRAFMTLAFTIFDLEKGTIRHTNAGHLYPYLLRDNVPVRGIESPSLPLGVRHEIQTVTAEVSLEEGDTIVYLSDGIVEAQNEDGDPFGFDQLEQLLEEQTDRSPSVVRDAILAAVARHAGARPADDDRTVMIIRFEQFRSLLRSEPELATSAMA